MEKLQNIKKHGACGEKLNDELTRIFPSEHQIENTWDSIKKRHHISLQ